MFLDWSLARNARAMGDPTLWFISGLMEMGNEYLCFALCQFVLEVRKKNGKNYPAETLYKIIICLQLYMHVYGRSVKLLDDGNFLSLRNTLDNRIKELSKLGCVKPGNKARIITMEEEEMLWQMGILGSSSLKTPIETLLYMFSLHFAL